MIESECAENDAHERLSGLLKRCRARIVRERASLGMHLRLPSRIGRVVTQEEVAEAVGISRQWYVRLESDRGVCPSAAVLGRIADTLMMGPDERAALFRLALPELRLPSPAARSRAMLDAFGSLRRVMRGLWAATSEAEALTIVSEYAMTELAPDEMFTRTRVAEGCWDQAALGGTDGDRRGQQYLALISQRWDPAMIDDAHCYSLMAQPGDVLTRSERDARLPTVAAKVREAIDVLKWTDASWAMANIRTPHASLVRLMAVRYACHEFSEIERAVLGTLADLASITLLGCVSSSRPL